MCFLTKVKEKVRHRTVSRVVKTGIDCVKLRGTLVNGVVSIRMK